jgi:general secretion pathway protein L
MNPLNSSSWALLRGEFDRLRGRWHRSPAQGLWQAWLRELHGALPERWRARLRTAPAVSILEWPADLASVPDGTTAVSRAAPAQRYALMLPASMVMAQRLSLPSIATRNLHDVLGFELDKHTPFSATQLYFDARVLGRTQQMAQVLLVAVLRERLEAVLEHCRQRHIALHSIDARDPQGMPLRVDLLPRDGRPATPGASRFKGLLPGALVALLLTSMLLWLNARQSLLNDMQAVVGEQRQQVDQLQHLRGELLNTRGAARYLAQQKTAQPTLTRLLAELTDCLGADTWLEQLEVSENGEVTMSGQSARASDLISRIKACPSLVDARFQGIIAPDDESGKDRFSLHAQLRKEAADASSPERS